MTSVIRSKTQALDVLDLDETASREAILGRVRTLLQLYHPDRETGDIERFLDINKAKAFLLLPVCRTCDGTKKVTEKNGRMSTTRDCPDCR